MEAESQFYARRAQEERKAAAKALSPEARKTHEELATTYERKAAESTTADKQGTLKPTYSGTASED